MSNPPESWVEAESQVLVSGENEPVTVSCRPPGPEGGVDGGPGGPEKVAGEATVLETSGAGPGGPGEGV